MRSEFRYPRAAAPMMTVIFAAVVLAIYRAREVAFKVEAGYSEPSFALTFGLGILLACLTGVAVWLVLHATHRSGVHRLSEAQTWPQAK